MLSNSVFSFKTSKLFSPFNRKSIYLCLAFLNAENSIFDKIYMLQTFYYYYTLVDGLNGDIKAQLDFTEISVSDYYVRNNLDKILLEMQKINDYKYFNKKYNSFIKAIRSKNKDDRKCSTFGSLFLGASFFSRSTQNEVDKLEYIAVQDIIDDEDVRSFTSGLLNAAPLDFGYLNIEGFRPPKIDFEIEVYNHANMFKKLILTGLLFWFIAMNSYGLRLDTGEGTTLHYIFKHIINLDFENPVLTTKTDRYKDEYGLIKNLNWNGEITKQDVAKLFKIFPMVNSENKR